MSARERGPKNIAALKLGDGSIASLANVESNDGTKKDINIEVNNEVEKETGTSSPVATDPMAALKAKMQASKAKESNKQVTVYLTPKNYERFNQLKEKGQKSELINQLLDIYFDE